MIELELKIQAVGQGGRAGYDLVPVSVAADQMGYSQQYIRRLADEGKLIAFKVSDVWLVHPTLIKFVAVAHVHDTS